MLLTGSNGFLPIAFHYRRRCSNSNNNVLAMTTKAQELQVLTGIRDIVDQYDTFLLDMW